MLAKDQADYRPLAADGRGAGSGFVEVRVQGRLLFEYDPERDLVRVKPKGEREPYVVDLRAFWPVELNQEDSES
jgi:hypothetical protein